MQSAPLRTGNHSTGTRPGDRPRRFERLRERLRPRHARPGGPGRQHGHGPGSGGGSGPRHGRRHRCGDRGGEVPRQRFVRRLLRTVVCGLLAGAALVLAGAAPSTAHAALVGSDPKAGAVVRTAPKQVSLTFSEAVAVDHGSLRVLDPEGQRVSTGAVSSVGSDTYRVRLRSGDLPRGTYTVAYQVVSADSHPVAGAFTFSVGAPSKARAVLPSTASSAGGGLVGGLYDTARYVAYAGYVLLVGGVAFILVCWPRGAAERTVRRVVVSGWVALTAATLALLLMRGAYTRSGKVADIFDAGLLADVLPTRSGTALVCRLLLLAVAAFVVAVLFGAYARRYAGDPPGDGADDRTGTGPAGLTGTGRDRRDAGLALGLGAGGAAVAIGLAATWALVEHSSVGVQAGVAMPVDIVHLLAVAVWLGGLATLLILLYRVPPVAAAAVRRFSVLALGSVVVLAATGTYQSWRQLGSRSALTGTGFGQLLLVKVGLIAVIVAIAVTSRRATGRLADAPSPPPATTPTTATAAASATSAASGTGAHAPAPAGPTTDPAHPPTPERAAQLARQRTAVEVARRKRLRAADPVRSALRRSVLAETVIAVAVLAVTTFLTSTESGRTAEAARAGDLVGSRQEAEPVALDLPYDTGGGAHSRGRVQLHLTPSHPGRNDLHIMVTDPRGRPVDVPEVTVSLTLPSQHVGPLRVMPKHLGSGTWSARDVQVPLAGDWRFDITVRTSEIDQVTVHKNAKIG